MNKAELPEAIRNKMTAWRNGFTCFPREYIAFHEDLAKKALEELKAKGVKVGKTSLQPDGWGDGMKSLTASIEYNGEVKKLQWHDGNQEFFVSLPDDGGYSRGSVPFKI